MRAKAYSEEYKKSVLSELEDLVYDNAALAESLALLALAVESTSEVVASTSDEVKH